MLRASTPVGRRSANLSIWLWLLLGSPSNRTARILGLTWRSDGFIPCRAGSDPRSKSLPLRFELNPSFAFAHAMLGMAYGYAGHSDEGLQHLSLAMRLSPRDPQQARYLSTIGLCHFMAKRFADAVEFERRAVQLRPHFLAAWRTLAAAAGLSGDRDVAVSALAEAKRLQPDLSIDWIEKYQPIVHEKDRAMYIEGLRVAGLE